MIYKNETGRHTGEFQLENLNNRGSKRHTCLCSQFKIVKYRRSARIRISSKKRGVNLVIIWGFLYIVFWKEDLYNLFVLHNGTY